MKSYKKYNSLDIRNRRLTWMFIIFFLLAVGIIRGERIALVLSETMLALMVLTYVHTNIIIHKIKVTQTTVAKAIEDNLVPVQLQIHCDTWLPIRWVCIKNYFGAESHSEKHKEFLIEQLDMFHKQHSFCYMARCSAGRGKYKVGPIEIIITDLLGIWMCGKTLPEKQDILILPAIVKIHSLNPIGQQRITFLGNNTKQKTGISYDFCGTREYRSGDNLRYIHWPATARLGKLIIKEFEQITTSRISIFLDLYHKSLQGYRPTNLDYAIKVAGSIGKYALDNSYDFRLFAKGKSPYHFPFGKNTAHLNWVLEEMALMKPNGNQKLFHILEQYSPQIQRGEEIVVIFSQISDATIYHQLLTSLQRRNITITVVFLVSQSFKILQEHEDAFISDHKLPQMCRQQNMNVVMVERGTDISKCFG